MKRDSLGGNKWNLNQCTVPIDLANCYFCHQTPELIISIKCKHNLCFSCLNVQVLNQDILQTRIYDCNICGVKTKLPKSIFKRM